MGQPGDTRRPFLCTPIGGHLHHPKWVSEFGSQVDKGKKSLKGTHQQKGQVYNFFGRILVSYNPYLLITWVKYSISYVFHAENAEAESGISRKIPMNSIQRVRVGPWGHRVQRGRISRVKNCNKSWRWLQKNSKFQKSYDYLEKSLHQ